MKPSGPYNHNADDISEALGVKKSREQMFAIAAECMIKGHGQRVSVSIEKAIELCDSPEELAIVLTIMSRNVADKSGTGKGFFASLFGK